MKNFQGFLISAIALLVIHTASPDELQKPAPGKKVKVFVLAGQSNMEGRANGERLSTEDRERLAKVQSRVQLAFNREPIRALDVVVPPPEIARAYKRKLIFGPELFFGTVLAEAWPDEKILLIKRSEGGTSLYGCWNPDWEVEKAQVMGEENEPKLYNDLTAYVDEILSGYKKDEYEICAMLWVQGETDAENETAAEAYGQILQTLIGRIRQDLSREDLPFLLFEVGKGGVIEGMRDTAHKLSDVMLIPQSLDPSSQEFYKKIENGHYNYEGMKKLGRRFAEAYMDEFSR